MKDEPNPSRPAASSPPAPAPQPAAEVDTAELLQQAVEHHRAGEWPQAEALYRQILQLSPGHVDALYLLGVMAYQSGQHALAIEFLDQAILRQPDLAQLHAKRGDALHAVGQHRDAVASFDKALLLASDLPDTYNSRGIAHHALGQFQTAIADFDHALALRQDFPEAFVNGGLTMHALQQYPAAVACFDQAIRLRPDFAEAHSNRGIALHALQQFQAAIDSYDTAIRLKPDHAETHNNRGLALHELRRYQEALAGFDRALELRPELAEAHCNRGNALFKLERYQDALASFDHAIQLNPDFADAHQNRGNALNSLGRYTEALEALEESIRLKLDLALAWSGRASSLESLQRYQAAIESCDQAIRIDPACAEAYANRGALFLGLQRHPAALSDFDQALALNPDLPWVRGMRLQTRRALCDWNGLEAETRELEARIQRGEKAAMPFGLTLSDSPALQRRAAEIYASDKFPAPAVLPPFPPRPPRDRIRIGYYSADFHTHAICNLMAGLFEQTDRTRFELFGFSFGPGKPDQMTERVAAAMDHFLDVGSMSDAEVVERSRELSIDIAVDLMGFTLYGRTGIFARRAAPIQVSYLGYPATMGVPYIDYLIADQTLIPESSREHYSEKIVYLPGTFQATDSTAALASIPCARTGEGLPEHAFVFCCFNGNSKIAPDTFDGWMRILARVPGSVLWLLEDHPLAAENLRKEAALRGMDPARLIFAQRVQLAEHLSRQRLADLFLDTFPFNAGATASPALWAGLPILTRMGQTFVSRMAASLLRAVSLSDPALHELITTTPEAYEALAVQLAGNPTRLQAIRAKLDHNRLTSPLFDTPRFTRNLEAAYAEMHARHQSHLPPDHIHIAESPRPA